MSAQIDIKGLVSTPTHSNIMAICCHLGMSVWQYCVTLVCLFDTIAKMYKYYAGKWGMVTLEKYYIPGKKLKMSNNLKNVA